MSECSVWPRVGTTVVLDSGYTITAAGAVASVTDEILGLLNKRTLLSYDPTALNPNPSPIPPAPAGSVLWVSVRDHGAVGDGVTDDYAAIREACDYMTNLGAGGTLYFPTGRYYIGTNGQFPLPSNTTVCGDGDGSVIIHPQTSGTLQGAISFDGQTRCRVTGMRFEWLHVIHFMQGVHAVGSTDITIDHCSFACLAADSEFPPPTGSAPSIRTLYAILFQDSSNVSVCDNIFYRMQVKGAGNTGCDKAIFSRNRFTQPFDIAISFVATAALGSLTNCIISDNVVTNPVGSAAFHVGGDGEIADITTLAGVLVTNNVVEGSWQNTPSTARVIITCYCATNSDNVQISGNTFRNTYSGSLETSTGIRVYAASGKSIDGLKVSRNYVYGFDQFGIDIQAEGSNWEVSDNDLPGRSRGIKIASSANARGISNLIVSGNTVANTNGIIVDATLGTIRRAIIKNNILESNRGSFENGVGLAIVSTGFEIQALVQGNRCYDTDGTFNGQFFGIRQYGTSGVFNTHYLDNDCRGNQNTGLQMLVGAGIGSGNRGGGFPSAAPASGTWDVGSRVQNHNPVVGQPKGWVCTVAGTPGTWVSEGNL